MPDVGASESEEDVLPPVDEHGNILWRNMWQNLNWEVFPWVVLQHFISIFAIFAVLFPTTWTYLTTFDAPNASTLWIGLSLWPITGLGVTAGMHRLWTHKSYEATKVLKIMLMVFASIGNQSTIWGWAHVHRAHHRFSDTRLDPHNRHLGFLHTHIGWIVS